MIYIVVFILSLVLLLISRRFENNKFLKTFFEIIALIIPCLLAGLRDTSIGTDVNVYVNHLFKNTQYFNSIFDFIINRWSNVSDPLYLALTYICAKISSNIFLLFFAIEALVIFPLYYAIKEFCNDKKECIIFGMLLFFLFFFNQSLNLSRQSIAISFSILSFVKFTNKDYIKSIIFYIIASLFHFSAAIMIVIFALYKIFDSEKFKYKKELKILLYFSSIISIVFLKDFIRLFISLGINDIKFSNMLTNFVKGDFSIVNTSFYLAVYLVVRYNKNRIQKEIGNYDFYLFISFLSIIILQSNCVIKFSNRIGFYFFYLIIFLILPKFAINFRNNNSSKHKLTFWIVVLLFIIYWVFWIVIQNYNETFPYVFAVI